MIEYVVVDTCVLVSAVNSGTGASRAVLRYCLEGHCQPVIGQALFVEYEDVFERTDAFKRSPLSHKERNEVLDAFLSVCQWTPIFYLWRPNLIDEADNHLIELAVAGGATSLITHNVRDFRNSELRFPQIRIETPADYMKHSKTT